jgi:hypothetical protein
MQNAMPNESEAIDAPRSHVAAEYNIGADAHHAENGWKP